MPYSQISGKGKKLVCYLSSVTKHFNFFLDGIFCTYGNFCLYLLRKSGRRYNNRNTVFLSKYVIMSANEVIVLLQNIRSLPKNFDEFVVMVSALGVKPVVICLTETWLNGNCDAHCFEKHGYQKLIACNKETGRNNGRGVAIYIKKF